MSHRFTGTPIKATSTKSQVVEDTALPGRPTPKFVYCHNPSNWSFHTDHGFIPNVTKIQIRPGVNGCKRPPNGHIPMLSRLRSDGWIPIDESGPIKVTDPESGQIVDDMGYLHQWEGKRGPIYQDAWSWPTLLGAGSAATCDWSSQFDRAGFVAWQVQLRDSGTVPPIGPGIAARLLKVKGRRADRRVADGHDGNPHIQAHVNREHAELEAMKTAAVEAGAKVKGRAPTAKKRGPGRPKKVTTDGS